MEEVDLRNHLLSELIDRMHARMADKMYPDEKPKEEEIIEAVKEEPKAEAAEGEPTDEEISEEDLAALMPSEE